MAVRTDHIAFPSLIEGRAPDMKPTKRENLFKGILEFVEPGDAALLLAVKDRRPLAEGITAKFIDEAYPGLLGPMAVQFDPA